MSLCQGNQFFNGFERFFHFARTVSDRFVGAGVKVKSRFCRIFYDPVFIEPYKIYSLGGRNNSAAHFPPDNPVLPTAELLQVGLSEKIHAEKLQAAWAADVGVHDAYEVLLCCRRRHGKRNFIQSDHDVFNLYASVHKSLENGQVLRGQSQGVGHIVKPAVRDFFHVDYGSARGSKKKRIKSPGIAKYELRVEHVLVDAVRIHDLILIDIHATAEQT